MNEYKTKAEIIYDRILEDIINGTYKHGDKLIISRLAAKYHVSETPVRDAILRMESKGFAKITANQSAIVSSLDGETLIGIFQIKGVLEGFATRLSIDYITPRRLKELRAINEQIRQAALTGESKQISELNMRFHLAIYECLPQKELYNMIYDLWEKWAITKSVFTTAPGHSDDSVAEHEEILRLIEAQDGEKVEMLVREHKFKAGYAMCNGLGLLDPNAPPAYFMHKASGPASRDE